MRRKLGPSPSKTVSAAERLRADVLKGIAEKRLSAGDRIQSERALARNLGVSYMTLRRALGALVEQGLLERRPRSGIYIAAGARQAGGGARRVRRVRGL